MCLPLHNNNPQHFMFRVLPIRGHLHHHYLLVRALLYDGDAVLQMYIEPHHVIERRLLAKKMKVVMSSITAMEWSERKLARKFEVDRTVKMSK